MHTGLKTIKSSDLGRQNDWLPIKRSQTETSIKKRSASRSIKRSQFPLALPWASTVHKAQGLSLEQGVINFDLQKQK